MRVLRIASRLLFGRRGWKAIRSCSQVSERHGDEHVAGLEAAAVGEHVHACARIVDLRDLVAEEECQIPSANRSVIWA